MTNCSRLLIASFCGFYLQNLHVYDVERCPLRLTRYKHKYSTDIDVVGVDVDVKNCKIHSHLMLGGD